MQSHRWVTKIRRDILTPFSLFKLLKRRRWRVPHSDEKSVARAWIAGCHESKDHELSSGRLKYHDALLAAAIRRCCFPPLCEHLHLCSTAVIVSDVTSVLIDQPLRFWCVYLQILKINCCHYGYADICHDSWRGEGRLKMGALGFS